MAWDPSHERVLLFGGDSDFGQRNDLDAWDGSTWASLATDGPSARDDALFVADPNGNGMVLFGGRSGQTPNGDTWAWDGTDWTELQVDGPPARAHAAAAYDHASKRVLMYGGVRSGASGDETMRDTWAWDGTAWTKLDDAGIPDRIPNGMAWDPTLGQLVILAVDLGAESAEHTYPSELWGWTGSRWKLVAGDGPRFSPLQQFVEGPDHPWLIDGGVVQGTFVASEWTGDAWRTVPGDGPPLRNGQAAAFDHERGQMVLFGGFRDSTVFGDTWLATSEGWAARPD